MKINYFIKFLLMPILLFLILISTINTSKMKLKNARFSFKTCASETQCEECTQEGYFKTCKNICYCCTIGGKCISQNEE